MPIHETSRKNILNKIEAAVTTPMLIAFFIITGKKHHLLSPVQTAPYIGKNVVTLILP